MSYGLFWQKRNDRLSYVTIENNNAILSRRETRTIENPLSAVYNFDTTKSINLRLRNFWSSANFSDNYETLQSTGTTQPYNEVSSFNPNADFNTWNMDVSFDWRFAPAINLTILYRNNFSNLKSNGDLEYADSLNQLFQESN